MIRRIARSIVLLLVMLIAAPAFPTAAAQTPVVHIYGMGLRSCATWLTERGFRVSGDQWLLGFWSAYNMATGKDVAGTSDGGGLVGEVELVCKASPSLTLVNAALRARSKLSQDGR